MGRGLHERLAPLRRDQGSPLLKAATTPPDTLPESERLKLAAVLAGCPELEALTRHFRAFGKILTQLPCDQLPPWIKAVLADNLPDLHTFVNGLEGVSPPSPPA